MLEFWWKKLLTKKSLKLGFRFKITIGIFVFVWKINNGYNKRYYIYFLVGLLDLSSNTNLDDSNFKCFNFNFLMGLNT